MKYLVFFLFVTLCLAQNKVRLLIIAPETECPDFAFLDSRFKIECRDSLLETDCDVLWIHRTKDTLDDIFANKLNEAHQNGIGISISGRFWEDLSDKWNQPGVAQLREVLNNIMPFDLTERPDLQLIEPGKDLTPVMIAGADPHFIVRDNHASTTDYIVGIRLPVGKFVVPSLLLIPSKFMLLECNAETYIPGLAARDFEYPRGRSTHLPFLDMTFFGAENAREVTERIVAWLARTCDSSYAHCTTYSSCSSDETFCDCYPGFSSSAVGCSCDASSNLILDTKGTTQLEDDQCICDESKGFLPGVSPTDICLCPPKEIGSTGTCVCDTSRNFVEDLENEGDCICNPELHLIEDSAGECVCDFGNGFVESDMGCICDALQDLILDDTGNFCICDVSAENSTCSCSSIRGKIEDPDNANSCICDTGAGFYTNNDQCSCDHTKYLVLEADICVCDTNNGYEGTVEDGCTCNTAKGFAFNSDDSACECENELRVNVEGECLCDSTKGLSEDAETRECVCDTSNGFVFDGNECTCRTPFIETATGCGCQENYAIENDDCVCALEKGCDLDNSTEPIADDNDALADDGAVADDDDSAADDVDVVADDIDAVADDLDPAADDDDAANNDGNNNINNANTSSEDTFPIILILAIIGGVLIITGIVTAVILLGGSSSGATVEMATMTPDPDPQPSRLPSYLPGEM